MKSVGGVTHDPPHASENPELLSNIVLFGVKEEGDLLGIIRWLTLFSKQWLGSKSQSRILVENHGVIGKLQLQLNRGLALAPSW